MYIGRDLTVTKDFLDKDPSGVFRVTPPLSVYEQETRYETNYKRAAELSQRVSFCTFYRDCTPFITEDMAKCVEQDSLFSFAYTYNDMDVSKHLCVVLTTGKYVKLEWDHSLWPHLTVDNAVNPAERVGKILFSNSGSHSLYLVGREKIEVDGVSFFRNSRFDIDNLESIQIYDSRGFDLLESAIRRFVECDGV